MLEFFRFIKPYTKGEKNKIFLILLFVILSQLLSLIEPIWFAKVIDQFLRDPAQHFGSAEFYKQLTIIALLWILTAFGSRVFKNLQMYLVETVSDRVGIRLFQKAFSHTLDLPLSYHTAQKSGETFRKISKARDDITGLFSVFFDKIFQNTFTITAVLLYVLYKSWIIGIPLFGFVPVFIIVTRFFTARIKRTQLEINKINENLYGNSVEALTHVEVVQSFAAEEAEVSHLQHDNSLQHVAVKKRVLAGQALGFAQGTVVNAARVILLWSCAVLSFKGILPFGDVVLFNFYSFYVYQPLYELGSIYNKYIDGVAAVERVKEVLNEKVWYKKDNHDISPDTLAGKIEFKNVGFSYDGKREILKNVSFVVPAGKQAAFVGGTGSGKSTIVKLLLRFYSPTQGQILLDDKPIESYDMRAIRKRVGLVLQDTILFNTTIENNIKYGKPNASVDEVKIASEKAHLLPFIDKLADKFTSKVGERGLQVSGGEKQRIAIARSIIKNPDILVFDEATSALDSKTENEIKQNIEEVSHQKTSLTVAHRFATVVNADEIFLLKDGEIVEQGTHSHLLEKNGEYARLYNLQTQRT